MTWLQPTEILVADATFELSYFVHSGEKQRVALLSGDRFSSDEPVLIADSQLDKFTIYKRGEEPKIASYDWSDCDDYDIEALCEEFPDDEPLHALLKAVEQRVKELRA